MPSSISSVFRLPPAARPGEPVRAEDFNLLRAALETLAREVRGVAIQDGPTIGARRTPGGTSLYLKDASTPESNTPMFGIRGLRKKDGGWVCVLQPGPVLYISNKDGGEDDIMGYTYPDGMDTVPYPETAVAAGQVIGIRVITDYYDKPTSVQIEAKDADSWTNIHAQPPPSESGEGAPPPKNGDYFYKLHSFSTGAGEILEVDETFHTGPILHVQNLQEFFNRPADDDGTYYEIYAKWNGDERRHEFHGILQLDGSTGDATAVEIINPHGTGGYDTIQYRGIRGSASSECEGYTTPQIKVVASADGKSVIVKGNNKTKNVIFTKHGDTVGTVHFNDGLFNDDADITIEICCTDGPSCS